MVDVVVHRADAEFGFLHDNTVIWHDGALVAAWYNCPAWEMAEASCIRCRRSRDGGRTWSPPEVIAADTAGAGILYVPGVFLSRGKDLSAIVGNMVGVDLVTRCELYALNGETGRWINRGVIAGPFLPNMAPVLMGNGSYIMGGRMAPKPAMKPEIPAVAISAGGDVEASWRLIPMAEGGRGLDGERFPESTLWVEGADITAIVRGGFVFSSRDYGESWSGPVRLDLPIESSKLWAGTLSTGQRYLVWNRPDPAGMRRNLLTLAVSRPGGRELAAMWKVRHGFSDALQAGPEWSYPCALEQDGNLHVIYTSEKKHSVMSIIPLAALIA